MALVGTASSPKMKVDGLKIYPLVYVGTPYTLYPGGVDRAYEDTLVLTGKLVDRGIMAFSPIVHAHAIKKHVADKSFEFWVERYDTAFMKKADCLIVAMMPTWEISRGLQHEIQYFLEAGKPVYYLDPDTLEV